MLRSSLPPAHAEKRRSIWLRILLGIIALLILIIIAAQIIFMTSIPRQLALRLIQRQIGLRMTAKSLHTGFFGHTTLQDVTVTLPLADKAFLTVPELKLTHTWPPLLLVGKSFEISHIVIEKPRLIVLQDPRGGWNLQEVAQLIARAGGSNQKQESHGIPTLPNINVNDATIVVTDNEQRTATIQHLDVTGTSNGPLVWEYRASSGDQLDIKGDLAPGGVWAHRVSVTLGNLRPWAEPWISSWPNSATLAATWTGQIDSGNVTGRLDLQTARYASVSITGPADVQASDGHAIISPGGLLVTDSSQRSANSELAGGQITVDSAGIQVKNVGVEFAGGRASINGGFTFADSSASLHAAWRNVALPASASQSGDLQFQCAPNLGLPQFQATFQDTGSMQSRQWDVAMTLNGRGGSLNDLSVSLVAQRLKVESDNRPTIDLSGLSADLAASSTGLLLQNLSLGTSHPLSGSGGYDKIHHVGWLWIDGRGWPIPAANLSVDADLNVWANTQRVHLEELFLQCPLLSAYLTGDYVYNLPKPVKAHLYVAQTPPLSNLNSQPRQFSEFLNGNLDLNGTLAPLDIALTGSAYGRNVHIGQRPLGNLRLSLAGNFRNDQVSIGARDIQLLGGVWNVSGQWPVHNSLFRIDNLSVQHLSLPLAADSKQIAGTLDGKWSIDVHRLSPDGITIDGAATVHHFAAGSAQSDLSKYLNLDQIQLSRIHLENGAVTVSPITLTRTIGNTTGHARLSLRTMLEHPSLLSLDLYTHAWPALAEGSSASCLLGARGHAEVDLASKSAVGHLDLSADVAWKSKRVAQVQTSIDADRRVLQATSIRIESLGGSGTGDAEIDLDHPYQSRAGLFWKDLNLSALPDVSGTLAGSLQIQPATVQHPLEPLAIVLHVIPHDAKIKNVAIGDLRLSAFLGPRRIVLDDQPEEPSQLAIAGGFIHLWARVSQHKDDIYQGLLQLTLDGLNLDDVIPAGTKVARTPGVLDGQITLVGDPRDLSTTFGQGTLNITQSDLAGTGPIAVLYNLMRVGHNPNHPTGEGQMNFTVASDTADITDMHYFDRGTHVRVEGFIYNLAKLPHCPVKLVGMGSAQPLKAITIIPGVSDINEALAAWQHSAIDVKITGYLNKPKTTAVVFSDITGDLKNILVGNAKAEKD